MGTYWSWRWKRSGRWSAQSSELRESPLSDAAKELTMVQAAGCRLLAWDEPECPRRPREIYDPVTLLYVLGNV